MSDPEKPRTSFFIEDILSIKDGPRLQVRSCSHKMDRCLEWKEEESENLRENHCLQERMSGEQTGETQLMVG